ncbi:LytR/AlgR family response regulator transcription factor [Ileibacterium valens]|uniref:LytR family transcriptional regulator n=1 Tax=Ileibacterium valens TaxID=1862668 RepID=A0A1U7NFT8_9FIRM|nr:LytTR family DNA-binding domain-containing protein [Ileibacterium valens]OLU36173.1 LytR family transcriptional regulator [Erysipelotrichaceae bacterium NYU-BL-F16]OLU39446.1 LytR family transcriptional regulator [Ileibacterium valens]OLU39510.1 LytR family transcriptional regulator [Erysipelotrichaceae bacterium NYU-BL-E8]
MIKAAILEREKESKDIIFLLGEYFREVDWTFRHFYKASELAKAMKNEQYQIFVFDEIFKSPRLESVFVHDNPTAIFIFVCENPEEIKNGDTRERIFYISKAAMTEDLEKIRSIIVGLVRQKEVYSFTYNSIQIDIPIEDIFYMEKIEKNVYFYTRIGTFHRRLNMVNLEEYFTRYGFMRVHVSYIVNTKYITGIFHDEVEINREKRIPLSRSQKKKNQLKVRKKTT